MSDYFIIDRQGHVETAPGHREPAERCAGCGTPMGRVGLCKTCKNITSEPLRTVVRRLLEEKRGQHEK